MHRVLFLFVGIICYCTVLNSAEAPTEQLGNIDAIVGNSLEAFGVPGAAIAVVIDGNVILCKGYGLRDIVEALPVTENTVFRVGSLTKAFTTLLIQQLVEEKRVAWDDLVTSHLPEFRLFTPSLTANVTIRDLAAHRLGIPRHDTIWLVANPTMNDIIALLQYLEPMYPLRERYLYNNFTYAVAGLLIERVTGEPLAQVLDKRILSPLEMHRSGVSLNQLSEASEWARPYAEVDGCVIELPLRDLDAFQSVGNLATTVTDMIPWMNFHLSHAESPQLVKLSSLDMLHSSQISLHAPAGPGEPVYTGYGLGWYIGTYHGQNILSHAGHMEGYLAEMFLVPEKKIGILILTNSSTDGRYLTTAVGCTILDRLLGFENSDWIAVKSAQQAIDKEKLRCAPAPLIAPLPVESLTEYVGPYVNPAYGEINIVIEEDALALCMGDAIIPLSYCGNDSFVGRSKQLLYFGVSGNFPVTFMRNSSGAIVEVRATFEAFRHAPPVTFHIAD